MSVLECRGQTRAILQLQRARRSERFPHSYIFHGPDGVGKSLLACQWARLMLCGQPVQRSIEAGPDGSMEGEVILEDSCEVCTECRLCESQTHPDLHLIHKELIKYMPQGRNRQAINLPIDVIREYLIKAAGVRPQRGRARVFIVSQAEQMTTAAQNALLKILEEPPPETFIILITAQLDRLLPTIRSRCQAIRFQGLDHGFIYQQLKEANLCESEAMYWSDFAQGRLGRVLELAGLELYPIKSALIEQISGLSPGGALLTAEWIVAQAKTFSKSYQKTHPDESSASATRQGEDYLLQLLSHTFSISLRISAGCMGSGGVGIDQGDRMEQIARRFSSMGCARAIRATNRARGRLWSNVNPTLIFETLMLDYLDCTC